MAEKSIIPVIDIFAGPGGLGEGFSAFPGRHRFCTKLSIEKDPIAHQTLLLRSFLRSFGYGNFPDEYYQYISDPKFTKKQLFDKYPENAKKAAEEAWQVELGPNSSELVHKRIEKALAGASHWVLLGGPPCQAYSLVGRARMTGIGLSGRELEGKNLENLKNKKLEDFYNDHRHSLYKEYLKIVAAHKPTIFVMENVKGILSSKQGEDLIFEKILSDLRDPWSAIESDPTLKNNTNLKSYKNKTKQHYRIYSFVTGNELINQETDPRELIIRAEDYGIPQRRHRVILLGILEDYDVKPKTLKRATSAVTVRQAIGNLPKIRSGLSKQEDTSDFWKKTVLSGFPPSFLGSISRNLALEIDKSLDKLKMKSGRGGVYISTDLKQDGTEYHKWISDHKIQGVTSHETRGHMDQDLWRYLYAATFAKTNGWSPTIEEFPKRLLPKHKNVNVAEGQEVYFKDRFKVQVAGETSTTITSHISKDGHYYIHYDPTQCRSLTVREAARLQTFPDNYYFEGNRTSQYHQVGNAVPPLLAYKLAHVVSDAISQCLKVDMSKHMDSLRRKEKICA